MSAFIFSARANVLLCLFLFAIHRIFSYLCAVLLHQAQRWRQLLGGTSARSFLYGGFSRFPDVRLALRYPERDIYPRPGRGMDRARVRYLLLHVHAHAGA